MRENIHGVVWRIAVFLLVCALGLFGMLAIFAELRFGTENTYRAEFANVSGLERGNFVRIAGVEVGKVTRLTVEDSGNVIVEFTADKSVVLTEGSRAVIRYQNLIGGRYLQLEEGAGGMRKLGPDQTIPLEHTSPALNLDALIGGFRPLFRALDPDQVNQLSSQLIQALQGEGPTISSFLAQTGALTSTLGQRSELIGEVISNLNTAMASLADHSDGLGDSVDALSELVATLTANKKDISNGIAYADEAARSIADLLQQARPPLSKTVREFDRTAGVIASDRDYLDNFLDTLPDAYRMLNRQGLYGDFFSFYLCDLVLKMNGKGGQPVYVKVAGQDTGRCTPR